MMFTRREVRPPTRPPSPPPSRMEIEMEKLEHDLRTARDMLRKHDGELYAFLSRTPPQEPQP